MSQLFIQNQSIRKKILDSQFSASTPTKIKWTEDSEIRVKESTEGTAQEKYEPMEIEEQIKKDEADYYEERSKEYSYLSDCPLLETEFSLCGKDIIQKYEVHIVGYQLVLEHSFPYLLFLTYLDGALLKFPSIPFNCAINIQEDEEGEKTPLDIYFENMVTLHILQYMEVEQDKSNALEGIYKGFVFSKEKKDQINVFMDLSNMTSINSPDKRPIWVGMDELLNRHQCLGFEIYKPCYTFFYQCPRLYNIYDERNEIQEIPKTVYICGLNNTDFVNLYNDYEMNSKEEDEYMTLDDSRVTHAVLGNFYYFSLYPLEYRTSVTRIRRFLAITSESYYVMQPVSKVKTGEAETNKQMVLSDVIPTLVSYLSKKDEKKKETEETENKEEEIKALEEGDESKYETTREKEEEITEEKPLKKTEEEEVTEEMDDQINLKSKSIYFIQVQEGRRIPFWCIKDNNDFVEI
jgi:hypothetical protein